MKQPFVPQLQGNFEKLKLIFGTKEGDSDDE
jgi:hypothetical protein